MTNLNKRLKTADTQYQLVDDQRLVVLDEKIMIERVQRKAQSLGFLQ